MVQLCRGDNGQGVEIKIDIDKGGGRKVMIDEA